MIKLETSNYKISVENDSGKVKESVRKYENMYLITILKHGASHYHKTSGRIKYISIKIIN